MDKYLKVLWIEDTADQDLLFMMPPFYLEATIDLDIAATASEGYSFLKNHVYDIIIVDIRIPPGKNKLFTQGFLDEQDFEYSNKMGLLLLEAIFENNDILEANRNTAKYGVFSIERKVEILSSLRKYGISKYLKKTTELESTALLEFVKEIKNDNN